MGCISSSQARNEGGVKRRKIRKPKPWAHTEPITRAQLMNMREEFWDTSPHYGGQREIWEALRAAAEAELKLAQTIIDSALLVVVIVLENYCPCSRIRLVGSLRTYLGSSYLAPALSKEQANKVTKQET